MWHLRSSEETVGRLFHTLGEVNKFILKYATWHGWQLDFIPLGTIVEEKVKSPSDSAPEPHGGFPVPMSQP